MNRKLICSLILSAAAAVSYGEPVKAYDNDNVNIQIQEKQDVNSTSNKSKKGLVVEDGKTYYYNSNGTKSIGWKTINKNKYYFGEDEAAVVGWNTISN